MSKRTKGETFLGENIMINPQKQKNTEIWIAHDVKIESYTRYSRWHIFWARFLLGWKIKNYEPTK